MKLSNTAALCTLIFICENIKLTPLALEAAAENSELTTILPISDIKDGGGFAKDRRINRSLMSARGITPFPSTASTPMRSIEPIPLDFQAAREYSGSMAILAISDIKDEGVSEDGTVKRSFSIIFGQPTGETPQGRLLGNNEYIKCIGVVYAAGGNNAAESEFEITKRGSCKSFKVPENKLKNM